MTPRQIIGRASYAFRRAVGTPAVLETDALAAELGRRLASMPHKKSARLVSALSESLPADVAAELMMRYEITRPMDYGRHPIELLLTSDALGNRLRAASKEPFTVDWIEELIRPRDVFYDIGANVGPYSLIAAKATGGQAHVIAIEPSAPSYRDLCRNIVLNGCEAAVTPLPFAVWSRTAMIPFAYRSMRSGDAQHVSGAEDSASAVYTQPLVAFSVDDLVGLLGLPVPNHAKIDVDGPELEVLRGAEQTLGRREWRSLLIEVDATGGEAHEHALCSVLERHGFRVRDRHDRGAVGAPAYVSFERDAA